MKSGTLVRLSQPNHHPRHRAGTRRAPDRRRLGAPALKLAATAVVLLALSALVVFYVVVHHHSQAVIQHAGNGKLVDKTGYYVGVAEANEVGSYKPINQFASAIGQQPNIVLYYSAWDDPFEVRLATEAHAHGAVPFVQMNPGRVKMAAVAAGRYDAYLRSYADQVRAYRHPVLVGFAPEMNGSWDSWGWHNTRPATWVAAWRHVVTVFRQQGASNAAWVWTVNANSNGTGPIQDWWPGASYVTWVGIDGYYFYSASTFVSTFGPTINQVRALTSKPVLLSETGIGQVAGQVAKIPDLFAGIQAAQLVGFVWFDQAQNQGIYHQDWRLENHPAALAAFRSELRAYQNAGP